MKIINNKTKRLFLIILFSITFVYLIFILINFGFIVNKDFNESAQKFFKIELSSDKLPPNFEGDNTKLLYERLLQIESPRKYDFEKTDEYIKRSLLEINSFIKDDTIYFLRLSQKPNYNLDNERINLLLKLKPVVYNGHLKLCLEIEDSTSTEKYAAQNPFGSKVVVTSRKYKKYYIAIANDRDVIVNFDNFNSLDFIKEFGQLSLSKYNKVNFCMGIDIPLSIDKAKQSSIELLILCKPRPDKSVSSDIHDFSFVMMKKSLGKKARYDSPEEEEYYDYYVFAEILGVWVYDLKSGDILAKYMPPLFKY